MKKIKEKFIEKYDYICNIFNQDDNSPKLLHKKHSFKDEDEELITGVIVILLIITILLSGIYYLLVFMPHQEELDNLKQEKINSVNQLLDEDETHNKEVIIAQINSANTPDEVNQINVEEMAYPILKNSLIDKIKQYKDKYDRVEIITGNTTDIMNTPNATNYIKSQDAQTLSAITIKPIDSVIIPININRKQAASGFISQGDVVDIYKTTSNIYEQNIDENSTDNFSEEKSISSTKIVGGSTIVSILRSKDSGTIEQNIELLEYPKSRNLTQSSSLDIEQILSSKAAGSYDEKQLKLVLEDYGVRLSKYERTSNIGDLDVEYIIMLEVPRENVENLIDNMDNIILTLPTYDAPSWVKL